MECQDCGGVTEPFTVPETYRAYVPGQEPAVSICTRCLSMYPVVEPPEGDPDFSRVSDAFPLNPDGEIAFALLVGLLENLALYRSEITELLIAVEESGTDPLLALDRLASDPGIETGLDLSGRRRQLEQLL